MGHDLPRDEGNAAGPPGAIPCLIVRIGELRMAIPASCVDRLYAPQQVTPVPLAPEHIVGISNFEGVVIPVIDICRFLGGRRPDASECSTRHQRVVVVSVSDMTVGIVCDEARGFEQVRRDTRAAVDASRGGDVARLTCPGRGEVDDGELLVLKVGELLDEARVKS